MAGVAEVVGEVDAGGCGGMWAWTQADTCRWYGTCCSHRHAWHCPIGKLFLCYFKFIADPPNPQEYRDDLLLVWLDVRIWLERRMQVLNW